MQTHIPTMFLLLVISSLIMMFSIVFMTKRHNNDGLNIWALALASHAVAYTFFGLRGHISDVLSIMVANIAITATFALFTEALYQFQGRKAPRWLIWSPVALTAILFPFFLDNMRARIIINAVLVFFQCSFNLVILVQKRKETAGRGQYGLALGLAITSLAMVARGAGTLGGFVTTPTIYTSNPIQTLTFISSLTSIIFVGLALLVMNKERAEHLEIQNRMFTREILDSISSEIAVIDTRGIILETNNAWKNFTMTGIGDKNIQKARPGIGMNYLDGCLMNQGEAAPETTMARNSILDVLEGKRPAYSLEYQCRSGSSEHWLLMNVTQLRSGIKGAVVVHTDITERKIAEEKIHNLAYFDTLTGLPNRRLLDDRLSQSIARSTRSGLFGAVMFIDLDRFKPINDTYGHAVGDQLLIETAHRLTRTVREVDTVARLGGDEFIVLLDGLSEDLKISEEQSVAIAEKIRADLERPYCLEVHREPSGKKIIEHQCTASIGFELFRGSGLNHQEIVKRADEAMYRAKAEGKNTVKKYQHENFL